MTPQRQEQLLALADEVTAELREVSVPWLAGGVGGQGIPQACVGAVTSYLARVRDRGLLETFVAQLDQLDPLTAQNQDRPRACYRVLRVVLQRLLREHPELSEEDWLYTLSWVRRLLPAKDRDDDQPEPSAAGGRDASRPPSTQRARPAAARPARGGGFNTLADAMRDAGVSPSSKPRG